MTRDTDPFADLLPHIEALEALFLDLETAPMYRTECGAHARTTGKPCRAPPRPNGRCKLHGGKSTGPRTPEGKARIAAANRR